MGNNDDKQDLIFSVKLQLDFGGGSSCCCCDRGKTKSTPSPKTEFWPLDLGLEFENIKNVLKI